MRLEHDDGQIGAYRYNHQRKEQAIASGQLGYQEHTGQRGMHHSRHQPSHAHQGEILFRHIRIADMELIAYIRKDKSGDAAQEQARSKDTAASASTVGGTRSEHLKQDNQEQVRHQQM